MNRLENLRQVTENTLQGLTADDSLKFRILQRSASMEQNRKTERRPFRALPVLCAALAVLLITVTALNSVRPVPSAGPGEINSFTAGSTDAGNPAIFPSGFNTGSIVSMELDGFEKISDPAQCRSIIALLQEQAVPAEDEQTAAGSRLVFTFEDNSTCVMTAEPPYLTGEDGRQWYCPGFFSGFTEKVE